jgi:hypothetical protein
VWACERGSKVKKWTNSFTYSTIGERGREERREGGGNKRGGEERRNGRRAGTQNSRQAPSIKQPLYEVTTQLPTGRRVSIII